MMLLEVVAISKNFGRLAAVREVLAEIGATDVPEQVVVNKTDAADDRMLARLRRLEPDAVFVSARTGDGLDALREIVADRLPTPDVDVDVLVPYDRGDLVARVHDEGEVLSTEHTGTGTRLHARVPHALAGALTDYME